MLAVHSLLEMHQTGGGMNGMGWMMWLFMMLFWILVLLALAAGIYWLITALLGKNHSGTVTATDSPEGAADDAMRILNERYARGEIDDEEYTRRKQQLTQEED